MSKKQGTVLLHSGGDALAALHATLSEYRSKCLRLERELHEERRLHEGQNWKSDELSDTVSFCMNFNNKVHTSAPRISQMELCYLNTIHFQDIILSVDPLCGT